MEWSADETSVRAGKSRWFKKNFEGKALIPLPPAVRTSLFFARRRVSQATATLASALGFMTTRNAAPIAKLCKRMQEGRTVNRERLVGRKVGKRPVFGRFKL